MNFPKDFVWGAAAASYQIEGATQGIDGCGESVWDMCCKQEGFVRGGDTGFVACDHYHRYPQDVQIMKELGLHAYRLSVMWPRVLPQGTGAVNERGLDFYDRLVDSICEAGITPWVTLFHWDYPLALFHRGGWLHEDSPHWFADYTRVIVDRLSDRVRHWFTLNEPAAFIGHGHQAGQHAPGLRLAGSPLNRAWHHVHLAHGRAVQAIRATSKTATPAVGTALCFETFVPATEEAADIEAARRMLFEVRSRNMFEAAWNLDPCLRGVYPEDGLRLWGLDAPIIREGDMELIRQPVEFLGINIYSSTRVKAGPDGDPVIVPYPNHHPHTAFDWPITPDSLRWTPRFLHERYGVPILITENGLSTRDAVSLDGQVHDPGRIDFLARHLGMLAQGIEEGADVQGYFQWSILDNFEWAEGFHERFGLVHVDYETQNRTIKDSGYWYRDLIHSHGACLAGDPTRATPGA
jgi:beta-glucosidase